MSTPNPRAESLTKHLAEFDRKNAEIADWRRMEKRLLPDVHTISEYRERTTLGRVRAQVFLSEAENMNPSATTICEVHKIIFQSATKDAGRCRVPGEAVTFGGRQGAEPARVPVELARLEKEMDELIAKAKTPEDFCVAIAFYHARFVGIHPFMDGNGRTGRAIMEAQANRAGFHFDMRKIAEAKPAYIAALDSALDRDELTPLATVIGRAMGIEPKFENEVYAASTVASRPMLSLDDIYPLHVERARSRTGRPLPLPSCQGQAGRGPSW